MLIPVALVATALLVIAYIVGSELCLPCARQAVRTGDVALWITACRLVALGEWAMIGTGACVLMLAGQLWQPLAESWPFRLAGLLAAGILAGLVVWELAGRTRRNTARVMSRSLDLVLPPDGAQREFYTRRRGLLESGSRTGQEEVMRDLLCRLSG